MINNNQINQFKEKGYLVIDNFLDINEANKLNEIFKNYTNWERIDQVRETHYQHVFATDSENLPKGDEYYMARFWRSKTLEESPEVINIYNHLFLPDLNRFTDVYVSKFELRCYNMKAGDFMRSHIDNYIGEIGCIYYINKSWKWDWGGLLHVNFYDMDHDFIESILPKFNRIVLLSHKKFKFPHFVSTVNDYAKDDRFTLISFNS